MVTRKKLIIGFLLLFFSALLFAHETWFLTPAQIAEWNAKPLPPIFTQVTFVNFAIISFTVLFLIGWVLLGRTGAKELFPDFQIRLYSYGRYASVVLRYATGIMLLIAAFGLNIRTGAIFYSSPTLLVPDLQLSLLGPEWYWIRWLEIIIAVGLIAGIYVRLMAFLLFLLGLLGLYLFGVTMLLPYLGFIIGISLYLILQGPGYFFIPLPVLPSLKPLIIWFKNQPRDRAQFLLRMFAGLNFIYAGVAFKILQPNLAIGVLTLSNFHFGGMQLATIVFWMAIIETLAGVLLLLGILMRPMSIILLICFVLLGHMIGENPIAHIMFYGALITFLFNGAGQWKRPIAKDHPATILILGASFAGIHCAMKLERLRGYASNVNVILIHNENYFQFEPLLAEVISGALQAGSLVNPIRRICPRTQFIEADIKKIDPRHKKVELILLSGKKLNLNYDELIITVDKKAEFGIPGLLEYSLPIMNIGDALRIRQQVLESLEQAEMTHDKVHRRRLLTFSVIGGGIRGCSVAAGIIDLLKVSIMSYPKLSMNDITVYLFEGKNEILPTFDPKFSTLAYQKLSNMGIRIKTNAFIEKITANSIVTSHKKIASNIVICALTQFSPALSEFPQKTPDGRIYIDPFLRAQGTEDVFVAGVSAAFTFSGKFDYQVFQALREAKMGRWAGYNAYFQTQKLPLREWKHKHYSLYVATLGRFASVAKLYRIMLSGFPAWFLSRYVCLLTLPGLERNLRILIDWILDIPFRHDIGTISPRLTTHFGRAHFDIGDEIIHQGDKGDCAYLILAGETAVIKTKAGTPKQIATLREGDIFGEIASLEDIKRTATIKCLTPVEVIVLPRDQFFILLSGYHDLHESVKKRTKERLKHDH